jgi:hypothetical protein
MRWTAFPDEPAAEFLQYAIGLRLAAPESVRRASIV